MENDTVKDLMIPLDKYATIQEGSTLFEAVLALEKAQEAFDQAKYRHRTVLVIDHQGMVVGKLSHLDALRALEPVQDETDGIMALSQFGFSGKFVRDLCKKKRMQAEPLKDLCKRAMNLKVEDFMQAPAVGQCIDQNASLDLAIHQLVFGDHSSLLATRDNQIVGILRSADVFAALFHAVQSCSME